MPVAELIGPNARFVLLTGLSGAGKSQAIHALEDLGYFCVDNLPTALIPTIAEQTKDAEAGTRPTAVVVDIRDADFARTFPAILEKLRFDESLGVLVIFLEANDETLIRRYSETRRPHPLTPDQSAVEGISKERKVLAPIKALADRIFDTSDLTVHELRRAFIDLTQRGNEQELAVTLVSFGYKHGVPVEADLLFDVRFLPNPYFVKELKGLTGRDPEIQAFLDRVEATGTFLEKTTDLLRFLIPHYMTEGKTYVTIAVGCTGGRHRSVMVTERLREQLAELEGVLLRVKHRDVCGD